MPGCASPRVTLATLRTPHGYPVTSCLGALQRHRTLRNRGEAVVESGGEETPAKEGLGRVLVAHSLSREAVAQKGVRAGVSVWVAPENSGMAQNFLTCDREQSFLLPPDLREWLPEDHLAWFVIDAVGVMDLSGFYAGYREDGLGRAAYEPSMVVALILYCWSRGMRSSRRIERACMEDVACRVIAANQRPDHATIARFIERHKGALADLFGEVLVLCADAGLATVGVVAIDGTKVAANANRDRAMGYEQIAQAIVEEAIATDAAEDAEFGDRRGDELPEAVATRQGRRGWLRDAAQRLERERAERGEAIPRSRGERLVKARERLEEELTVERQANRAYESYRARGVDKTGRRFGAPPKPYTPPEKPDGKVNLSDPDSKLVHGMRGWVQGYNAQTVCNEQHLILAAEVMTASPDFGHLEPMLNAAQGELAGAGVNH